MNDIIGILVISTPSVIAVIAWWIYFDARKIREQGVSIVPGIVAFLVVSFSSSAFLLSLLSIFPFSNIFILIVFEWLPPLIYLVARFIIMQRLMLSPRGEVLSPSPSWTKHIFVIFSIGVIVLNLFLIFILITLEGL